VRKEPGREKVFTESRKLWDARSENKPRWDTETSWAELEERLTSESVEKSSLMARLPMDREYRDRHSSFGRGSKNPGNRYWLLKAAAAILLIGFASLLIYGIMTYMDDPARPFAMKHIITEPGQRANIQLDDGTRIRMNAGSSLQMPDNFSEEIRAVQLSGEAYFEVSRDARPFYVVTGNHVIEVLGTEFNVQTYSDEPFRVVVSRGVVSVHETTEAGADPETDIPGILAKKDTGTVLEAGQILEEENGLVRVSRDVDLDTYLAWLNHRLIFVDTPLDQVARTLERWYRLEVEFGEPEYADLRVTASFEDEPLDEVLRILSSSLNLNYEIHDRKVVFNN
jgi:transmembrane sensor